jgi:hypothetical protein
MNILNLIDFYEDISDAMDAFAEESDRGVVLISAALIDETLGEIIRKKLVSSKNRNDELFEIPYAPLKSFSAKINFSYRLGLISKKTHLAFHQIRDIRNEFAHGFLPTSFEDQTVFDKILNILSHYYGYIIEILFRTLVDEQLLKEIKEMHNDNTVKKNANKILKLVGTRNVYERICAFIYACLKDKEQKILQLNFENSDSVL